jgi:hypothetical protein
VKDACARCLCMRNVPQPAASPFLVTKPTAPKDRRRKEPEISWEYTPRIEPGEYRAYCCAANVDRDRAFKLWVFAAQFEVFGSSLPTLGEGRAVRVPARALELWIEQRTRPAGIQ